MEYPNNFDELDSRAQEILQALNGGGSLRYFYLSGGVPLHTARGEPSGKYCDIGVFLDLRQKGIIEKTGRKETGYPYYADNAQSDVYTITDVGRLILESE